MEGDKQKESSSASREFWQGMGVMVLAVAVLAGLFSASVLLESRLRAWVKKSGIKISPNFDGGLLLARFPDQEGDLLPQGMEGTAEEDRRFDILAFEVRKVKFLPGSGLDISPRLNLVFEFNGRLPDPAAPDRKSGLPVIHVYMDSPTKVTTTHSSDKIARVEFAEDTWDYEVIIDGEHDQARIFDGAGNFVGQGVGLYFTYDRAPPKTGARPEPGKILRTRLTAALPLAMVGDPAVGQWAFYVITGIFDPRHPSLLHAADPEEPPFRDCVLPTEALPLLLPPSGRPRLLPVKISPSGGEDRANEAAD